MGIGREGRDAMGRRTQAAWVGESHSPEIQIKRSSLSGADHVADGLVAPYSF